MSKSICQAEAEARVAALDRLVEMLNTPDALAAASLILAHSDTGVFPLYDSEEEDDDDGELWVTPPRDLKR